MSTEVSASIINEELDAINISNELSQKYLLFVSDNIDFGVKASYIIEIITNHHITPLPLLPGYIKGIINLRGQIIPILDIRSKMGKAEGEYTNSVMVGIYVDTVSLVADIDESKISPPSPHNKQELVNGMVSMSDGKTLFLIDCEKLIEN